MTGWRRVALILTITVTTGLSSAGIAAADPGPVGDVSTGDEITVDQSRWPAGLDKFIPGSPQYEASYGSQMTDPIQGQCADQGGDLWAYTRDFIADVGAILDAVATATGQAPLQLDGTPIPTAPWDATGFANSDLVARVASDGGAPVFASPGQLLPFDNSANPAGPCLDDLAPYGDPDGASTLGFDFYPAPDDGSIAYLRATVAKQQPTATTTHSGGEVGPPSQYWDPHSDNALRAWSYSPLDLTEYCRDGNPFCATAAFLHCPGDSDDPSQQQSILNCRIFNANIAILNQRLALWLDQPGVGQRTDGRPMRLVDVITDPGSQAPLDLWQVWASDADKITTIAHTLELVLAGGLLAGAFLAGGLVGVLVAAGVVALAGGALAAAWGAITCGTDLGKCLAKAGADALSASMGLVRTTAATGARIDLGGYGSLFDTLAGLAGVLLIILFLLTLVVAAWTGRLGKILPAGVGLLEWAIMVGLGSVILTSLGALSDTIADAIAAAGSSTDAITDLAKGMATTAADLPNTTTGGWLLAFFAAVVGALAGAVIWLILTAAPGFVPLAVGLMILQSAGMATSGWGRRWIGRGFSLLWTIMLLRPAVALVSRIASIGSVDDGLRGLIIGCLLLCIAALAPMWVGRMFPLAGSETGHLGAALFTMANLTRMARVYPSPLRSLPSRSGLLRGVLPPTNPGSSSGEAGTAPTQPSPTGPTRPPTPRGARPQGDKQPIGDTRGFASSGRTAGVVARPAASPRSPSGAGQTSTPAGNDAAARAPRRAGHAETSGTEKAAADSGDPRARPVLPAGAPSRRTSSPAHDNPGGARPSPRPAADAARNSNDPRPVPAHAQSATGRRDDQRRTTPAEPPAVTRPAPTPPRPTTPSPTPPHPAVPRRSTSGPPAGTRQTPTEAAASSPPPIAGPDASKENP